jgi:cysteine desulfurase/selenocysteine lyase
VSTSSPPDDGGGAAVAAVAMAGEIARLANQLFAGGGLPSNPAPSAFQAGAGGLSPAATLPPVPGFLQQPLIGSAPAAAPPPKESDPRAISATLSGGGAPFVFESAAPPPLTAGGGTATERPPLPAFDRVTHEFRPELVPALGLAPTTRLFDPAAVRRDFPILQERVHGKPLVWLDNAATTQKPRAVIDRLSTYYERENSNIHRAAHTLAARATDAYEGARDKVRRFLNAPSAKEIVFVRGATEAINLVAQSWGRRNVGAGDEIVISWLEHHANIVPWQQLASEKGARLRVAPVDDRGQVILEEYDRLLGPRTRIVSVSQVSNALGTIVPVREMIQMAHRHGARVLVDGAQAVSHMPVDVQALDCDFYCFSGHKVFAPTGIGALFGKSELLDTMPPWQGGGNMIADVTFERTIYQGAPARFEAGTGNIADAVGLGAALDYLGGLGLENVSRYEHELLVYGTERLNRVPGLRLIGTAPEKAGVLSFVLDGIRTEDVGGILDQEGIAVRSGHHCAQPVLRRFGLESTVRASLAPYNSCADIDALVAALLRLQAGRPPRGI